MAAASVAVLLQGGTSQAQTVRVQPSLNELVAEAKQLSNQVDSLGQQYDGLKIQIAHAKSEEYFAKQAAKQADAAMAGSQAAVAQLAAMGYMNGGMDPTLQLLTSGNPGQFLSQASTVEEVDDEAGMRLSTLQREQLAAERAQETATQEIATVNSLTKQINGKVSQINAKMDVLKSSEMSAAVAVFDKTGSYPNYPLPRQHRRRDRAAGGADPPAATRTSGPRPARPRSTAPASSSGPSPRRASRSRTTPGTCGIRACTSPRPTLSPATWCSSSDIGPRRHLHRRRPDGRRARPGQVVQVQPIFEDPYVGAVRISLADQVQT